MEERRRGFRWQIDRQAMVNLTGEPSYALCSVKDINYNGLQISSDKELPQEASLKLGIAFPDELALEIEAGVAWHKNNLYGLYFTRIKDQDKKKIYEFIYKNYRQQVNKIWWEEMRGL
jgi:c-di-GMP-binding flagellar brake protein YcgR